MGWRHSSLSSSQMMSVGLTGEEGLGTQGDHFSSGPHCHVIRSPALNSGFCEQSCNTNKAFVRDVLEKRPVAAQENQFLLVDSFS